MLCFISREEEFGFNRGQTTFCQLLYGEVDEIRLMQISRGQQLTQLNVDAPIKYLSRGQKNGQHEPLQRVHRVLYACHEVHTHVHALSPRGHFTVHEARTMCQDLNNEFDATVTQSNSDLKKKCERLRGKKNHQVRKKD